MLRRQFACKEKARTLLLAVAAAVLVAGSANAHGVWVAQRWDDLGIVYGEGHHDNSYDPAKVKTVRVLDKTAKALPFELKRQGQHATIAATGEPAVIAVDFDNGYWTEIAGGDWVEGSKAEVPAGRQSGQYMKHNVTLMQLGALPNLPAQTLQIVPVAMPAELKMGAQIRVRVLLDGRPLAGARVVGDYVNDWQGVTATTGANGEAAVAVRNNGLNVLAVAHIVPVANDPRIDHREHLATLAFTAGAP